MCSKAAVWLALNLIFDYKPNSGMVHVRSYEKRTALTSKIVSKSAKNQITPQGTSPIVSISDFMTFTRFNIFVIVIIGSIHVCLL